MATAPGWSPTATALAPGTTKKQAPARKRTRNEMGRSASCCCFFVFVFFGGYPLWDWFLNRNHKERAFLKKRQPGVCVCVCVGVCVFRDPLKMRLVLVVSLELKNTKTIRGPSKIGTHMGLCGFEVVLF